MKKFFLIPIIAAFFLSSCVSQFNQVYKTRDYEYKYEFAKECFVRGKYSNAITLLQELVTIKKGSTNAQECLYMLALSEYRTGDYLTAADYFKKYYSSYPKGIYAEVAVYNIGQSLYMATPEPRLDQTETVAAVTAFQNYLDIFPYGKLKEKAQDRLFELQDKLVKKELYSSRLYFNLGTYFGNCTNGGSNYEACIITAQNAIKDYPYTSLREEFAVLIMKSKFCLAEQSIQEKRLERYKDAEDECYGFINQYPDSKSRALAEKYIKECKKNTKL